MFFVLVSSLDSRIPYLIHFAANAFTRITDQNWPLNKQSVPTAATHEQS